MHRSVRIPSGWEMITSEEATWIIYTYTVLCTQMRILRLSLVE